MPKVHNINEEMAEDYLSAKLSSTSQGQYSKKLNHLLQQKRNE